MIYFDNGASSYPKPQNVYKNTFEYVLGNGANAGRSGHDMGMKAAEKVYQTRSAISRFMNVDAPENVVFTLNATYAINTVLQGLLGRGDHVITTTLEHNSVLRPLYLLESKGVRLDVADVDLYEDVKTVNNIARLIRPNTKAIVITQCSNVCGKMLPIREIAKLKQQGIFLVVDGAQGAGTIATDFAGSGIDYYCAPSHKGILGIQGSGFILCRHKELRPLVAGGTGGESQRKSQPLELPDRLEAGTLPIPSICSMLEGIRFLESVGIDAVFAHKCHLTNMLYRKLKQLPQVELYCDCERMVSPGVISFNIKGKTSEEVGEVLAQKGVAVRAGLHCAPLFHREMGTEDRGMVRVSFGFANTDEEVAQFVKILKYL